MGVKKKPQIIQNEQTNEARQNTKIFSYFERIIG